MKQPQEVLGVKIVGGLKEASTPWAGATAVQVGTATFANPRAALDVLEGIESFMERGG